MFKDTLRQKDKVYSRKTRQRECESTNKTDILMHNELSECMNERNKLQEILENELDVNSKLEDIVYKLQMNIKKIEREELCLDKEEIIPPTPPRVIGFAKAPPPRCVKNAKISGKKVYIKKEEKK